MEIRARSSMKSHSRSSCSDRRFRSRDSCTSGTSRLHTRRGRSRGRDPRRGKEVRVECRRGGDPLPRATGRRYRHDRAREARRAGGRRRTDRAREPPPFPMHGPTGSGSSNAACVGGAGAATWSSDSHDPIGRPPTSMATATTSANNGSRRPPGPRRRHRRARPRGRRPRRAADRCADPQPPAWCPRGSGDREKCARCRCPGRRPASAARAPCRPRRRCRPTRRYGAVLRSRDGARPARCAPVRCRRARGRGDVRGTPRASRR